jgi:hypothetical protein
MAREVSDVDTLLIRRRARTGILILNPSLHVSYGTLLRWIEERTEDLSIAVYGHEYVETLGSLLAPRVVEVVRLRPAAVASHPGQALGQSFASLVNRYQVIVVLCASDEEVTSGHTVYRIVAEALFSDHVVLVGPRLARAWPGGRRIWNLRSAREVVTLTGTCVLGLSTAAVALAALALQETLIRLRVLQ